MSAIPPIVLQNSDVFANGVSSVFFAVPCSAVPMKELRHRRIGTKA